MRGYHKSDVEHHRVGYGGTAYPAVNVKVYHFTSVDKVIDRFGCSEATAERALEHSFNMQQECFWEDAQGVADHYLGKSHKVYSEGRSGGWLIVDGLPETCDWDAVALHRWACFAQAIDRDVKWRTSADVVFGDIEANGWVEDREAVEGMVATALA